MKVCTDACILGAWAAGKAVLHPVDHILDIGCGTGLLSLLLAQKTNALIDAVEINKDAAEQAANNVEHSPWAQRINIVQGAIQEFDSKIKYDLIISNPPFYEDDLRSGDENKNAAKHDSSLKLEELLEAISKNLHETGRAIVLLPFHRAAYFELEANKRSLFVQEKLFIKQSPKHDYFRAVILLSYKQIVEPVAEELVIHDDQRNYTDSFKILLKDYYLNL